jgi:hypothetical protein
MLKPAIAILMGALATFPANAQTAAQAVATIGTFVAGAQPPQPVRGFEPRTVSSQPDTVSGDDALVKLSAPRNSRWIAELDGRDVTSSFRFVEASGDWRALLSGLKVGKNTLTLSASGGVHAKLELINHPSSGPVFSGPHQTPFICQTISNGLGPALDADCNARMLVQYYYKSTHPEPQGSTDNMIASLKVLKGEIPPPLPVGFKPYDPAGESPRDIDSTTTSDGREVPYIVRREVGVINRAAYDIRFLHQPGQPLPTPWTGHGPAWNGRLVYLFRGGCSAGYRQGMLQAPSNDEALVAKGYATATSSLNIFSNNCNDVVSAETLSMVKEHFIKSFGEPVHTIGWGESGGAMQQYLIAQNYPGLLDGIIPYLSFSDVITFVPTVSDWALLAHAISNSKLAWTEQQMTAISGMASWRTVKSYSFAALAWVNPRACDGSIPKERIYDPSTLPNGIRCDIFDNEVNVYGRDPHTGLAWRPLDNVGVQYGLAAFNSGKIDAEQFIELNEKIGGYDADGKIVANRTQADIDALRSAYRHGLVLTGGGGLSTTPIIDWRWYGDDLGDGHDSLRSFVTRARLIAANGNADNQVILTYPRATTLNEAVLNLVADPNPETSLVSRIELELVGSMDRWLSNIEADGAPEKSALKVARNKPSDLVDACWATDGEKFAGATVYGVNGECSQLYPRHADQRLVAGGPLANDVLKCELKPISVADYTHHLSTDQLQRLKSVFPSGVCNYARPGLGQTRTTVTWQHY